jgi:transcriptional regulator with GAF, ATPase, and Fis domain
MQEPAPSRLVMIGGVLTGEVFPLDAAEVTFGRDSSNSIGVPDAALSRLHCVFTREPAGWRVRDVGSFNGTFVNGMQVQSHLLAEGDRIAVGGCLLLYVRGAPTRGAAVALVEDENAPLPPTTRLAPEHAAYLRPRDPATPERPETEQGLRALLAISTAIHSIRDEGRLDRELLALIFEAVPAAEGAILQPGPGEELMVRAVHPSGERSSAQINVATVRRAIDEGFGLLCAESSGARPSSPAHDAPPQRGRSVIAVPISAHGRTLGAIYLTARAGTLFTEDHLQLVIAVGRISAIALDNIRQFAALEQETSRLQADLNLAHQMIGESEPVRQVYARIAKVARVDTTVLITGETGTGKELAARAIHINSARARRPFVAINCAALTESLLESELFGHERGAFTNAYALKKGKLELADGGTVFLDEVGELAPSLQSKLLRVLQEREFDRVGGARPIKVDLRILSATNRDLAAAVDAGRFRQDLYFRLNVISIQLPPLRDRRDDVPALARHFLSAYARKAGRRVTGISAAAMRCLLAYDWPGNVRELENAIERACVLGSGEEILQEDLPDTVLEAAPGHGDTSAGLQGHVLDAKRRAVIAAFRQAGRSYTETAKLLGVHPNYLHRLIRHLEIKAALERTEV